MMALLSGFLALVSMSCPCFDLPTIFDQPRLYPCSTKRREVLGNPSPPPNFPRPKRFPEGEARGKSRGSREIREIFRGRGFCTPRPEGFPEGEARGKSRGSRGAKPTAEENLEGGGDGFPNTSRVLVEHGHSLIITREGLIDNFILCSTALISPCSGSF